METKDHIGPDPVKWLDRLIEVNAGSSFHPRARSYIEGRLRELQNNLRELRLGGQT
jgi:hypothetical protein